ncbi:Six-hairpin glycosidase-like protein [Syncephalis fuscata]|nr:Six-hairpin glycosidase-like protein [Syncephalis fuscata]
MSTASRYTTWRQRYLRDEPSLGSGQPCRYVAYNTDGSNGDAITTSESSGYGLLISVLNNAREDFDAILRFTDHFMNSRDLLGWQQRREQGSGRILPGNNGGENSATDGDLDCVAALWMAHKRWGNNQYADRARRWGNAILNHCINSDTGAIVLGDWANFNKWDDKRWLTRPSDYVLGHLTMFSRKHTDRSDAWNRVINATRSIMNSQYKLNPNTGLVADFLKWDSGRNMYMPANGFVQESSHDGDFNWNACRVPWRLAQYYFYTRDSSVLPHLQALVRFFEARCSNGYVLAGYQLNGQGYVNYTNLAFLAPAAYCLKIMNSPLANTVFGQMDQAYPSATYYGETISLITLLQAERSSLDLMN